MIDVSNTVFVFDLDDTLYQEADYRESGLRHVVQTIQTVYNIKLTKHFLVQLSKSAQPLDTICNHLSSPQSLKETLLWEYRLHRPTINLNPGVADLLSDLQKNSKGIVILTDGRSITQKLKIIALGLDTIPSYISEDYGSEKPEPLRFKLIEEAFNGAVFVYIGDNPKKDFVAPNDLGWQTFCIKSHKLKSE